MSGSFQAELVKLVRRPAAWLLLAITLVLAVLFTYVFPYAGYAAGTAGPNTGRGLPALLPDRLVGNALGGLPVFLGAIVLILGVLVVGGEYGWGTWKTVLSQGPYRLAVYAGKLLTLAVAALVVVLAVFGVGALSSALIAAAEAQPVHWPGLGDLLIGIGAGWLIATMWAMLGVMLAVALRAVALPVGLGLVWMLAVQNLLTAIAAPLLDWVAQVQKGLPGPNAGSLAAALGASSDTPGVLSTVGGGQGALVVAAYLVAFAAAGAVLLRRRDIS
ncbi:ABC transporter permease [Micromonospora avicenniae]|uniref:ABC-type transport system involved in multi-copper enzyme maturation, permease component n=1 Tax=Micromonospora avicenniae TaxID=1198245 RepID=A0A1N6YC41_9ACTN|nr:ABC transporter permease subunit [Micromonospora avicenniae]SIR12185.1 ABC-type transport system involved in multi-copper enzyme maturation, permease component [Micromonospora avicenniae]